MFNLTHDERKAALFLITVLFAGLGINFTAKQSVQLKKIVTVNPDLGKLDLNKASLEDLLRLRILSPKLSEKIIALRDEKGSFASLEELRMVKGVSDKRLRELEELLFIP